MRGIPYHRAHAQIVVFATGHITRPVIIEFGRGLAQPDHNYCVLLGLAGLVDFSVKVGHTGLPRYNALQCSIAQRAQRFLWHFVDIRQGEAGIRPQPLMILSACRMCFARELTSVCPRLIQLSCSTGMPVLGFIQAPIA